jgi:hypothetical protein
LGGEENKTKQNKGEVVGSKNRKIRSRFLPMFYEFLGWRKWNFRLEVLLICLEDL